ncbi:MAG: ATP-binding protein [Candidatus Latescibacterota bacterium]|jgi:two-component system phosphate regulon sensor histidine kinase PhoR
MAARRRLVLSHAVVALLALGAALISTSFLVAAVVAGLAALAAAIWWGRSVDRLALRLRQTDLAEAEGSSSEPALAAEGPLSELQATAADLQRRTRERLALLAVEKSRVEGILESVTEGIMVTGIDGKVVMANRALASLFGTRPPLEGRTPVEVVRHREVEEAIAACQAEGRPAALEVVRRAPTERFLEVQVAPIRRDGTCIGVVTVFHDITRLRQLERVRRDFVANVSHELRTPLTAIKGYAETLAEGALQDPEAAGRFVQVISSHADRLHRLLDDILDLARLEQEGLEVRASPTVLRPLVEGCVAAVAQAASRKGIALAVQVPPEIVAWCDGKLIEQVVTNLLDNAVKYTPEGGAVTVRALAPSDAEPRIVVEVSDTGIGIPAADLERVFERFYRVDKGRSRALGGTGLGLSIVRHAVQAHGERVWATSELGHGSTFHFTLKPE